MITMMTNMQLFNDKYQGKYFWDTEGIHSIKDNRRITLEDLFGLMVIHGNGEIDPFLELVFG